MDTLIFMDLISIVGGLFLILAPEKAYNFGRREADRQEIPANWTRKSRIAGAIFVLAGVAYIIIGAVIQ